MKIIKNLHDYSGKTPLALSIGMFDGVHRGHQTIIKNLHAAARKKKLETAVLTFWPHPRTVFSPHDDLKLLTTIEEKTDLLEKNKVLHLFLKEFDEAFRNLSGEEFVKEILVEKLNVKHLIIGYDHTFGKNRTGDFNLLQEMSSEFGFEVEQVEAVDYHDRHISSTRIRNALQHADITAANEMLGYRYAVSGEVVHGEKLGRTIGYPTANISVNPMKFLPKKGAYIVDVLVRDRHFRGMMSIGTNPTVNGAKLTAEVYILNFNENLYGKEITVHFRDFLHSEIKFESIEKLIERLDEDKRLTENFKF